MPWFVSQIGAREHYLTPVTLQRKEVLTRFYTDYWCAGGKLPLGGTSRMRSLQNRFHPEIPPAKVSSANARTLILEASVRAGFKTRSDDEQSILRGETFGRFLQRSLSRTELNPNRDIFFGQTSECLEAIEELHARGIPTVLNQSDPGRTEKDLAHAECAKWPDWEKPAPESPSHYWRRIHREWKLASIIVVNSDWSRQCLVDQGVPEEKIRIIPLAYEGKFELPGLKYKVKPAKRYSTSDLAPRTSHLSVLFLSTVCLRKGIQYYLEAARQLENEPITFTVAGPIRISEEAVLSAPRNVQFIGRVRRDQVSSLYADADVYVLPTISDGFALTQLEAMAHGLPVITTAHSGDVVTSGKNGFIIPVGDSAQLARHLADLSHDRDTLRSMSETALRTAAQFSVTAYGDQLSVLGEELSGKSSGKTGMVISERKTT